MALTNYTIASPNGDTWTIQSTNSASAGRYHDLGFLSEGSSTNMGKSRPGILGASAPAASAIPSAMQLSVNAGLTMNVAAGAAVVERGTLVGPYRVDSTTVATVTLGTADATNPRIDRVDLRVLDGALGDNGGVSLTQFIVTQGTASGSPAVPTAPTNSIPLGQVLLPAGTVTITTGMITDTRKSAGIRGASRVLLPGDSLADPGFMAGEERTRYHATYGWLNDIWDPVASLWRGTQELLLTQPTQLGSGTLAAGTTVTIANLTTVDPGWPYHIVTGGMVDFSSLNTGDILQASVNVNSGTININAIARGRGVARAGGALLDQNCVMASINSKLLQASGYTGAQILDFVVKNAGSGQMNIFNGTSGDPYVWSIALVPAGL
jgi:hypothetical protein